MGTGFEFRLLGSLEVRHDGRPVVVNAAKQRILLASLLVNANRVVPVDTLMNRLWGECPPGRARNTLQNHVVRLRRVLGRENSLVQTRPQGYQIEVGSDAVDLQRFDRLVRRARATADSGDVAEASALLRQGLSLWRSQPLSDIPSDEIQREIVPALMEHWLDTIEMCVDLDLRLGRHADVLRELRKLTTTYPLRERFWAQNMLALHRAGRRSESLACYREVTALLAEQTGLDPGPELRDLHRRILAADPDLAVMNGVAGSATTMARTAGNLPAEVTSFVGRGEDLAYVRSVLGAARLVTLTGPGGVGKSRLALRAAAQVTGDFPDGVWLVDVLRCVERLPDFVADALGFRSSTELLRGMRALLVLDNVEHLVDAVSELAITLLSINPSLRILVTSRQRLSMSAEHTVVVAPLALSEAMDLLVDRAASVVPGFRVTDRNRDGLARLCIGLDGIPMALELAAARLSVLSPSELADRVDGRFRVHSLFDRSYELCTPGERLLWARLCVLPDDFDLATAEDVGTGDGIASESVVDLIVGLVHKSVLVSTTVDDRARYRFLTTLRQYGLWFNAGMSSPDQGSRIVSARREIAASATTIFELIADPTQQPRWDGNDNLAEAPAGQRVRARGDVFRMTLTKGNVRENHVVEFEEQRRIAWRPAEPGNEPPGHLWRWELEPIDASRTAVVHTYDWTRLTDEKRFSRARETTVDKLQASLDRLAALAEDRSAG